MRTADNDNKLERLKGPNPLRRITDAPNLMLIINIKGMTDIRVC